MGGSTNEETRAAMVAHHGALVAGLEERVRAAEEAAQAGPGAEAWLQAVARYLETEVIPHAEAEEMALYSLADTGELSPLVRAMVTEHAWLRAETQALAGARGVQGAARSRAVAAVFALHAGKENDLILPALAARPDVDLSAVLERMKQHLAERAEAAQALELDVRKIPHASRHDTIFSRLGDLQPGQALVILNDHDPQPLHYQLEALWPGTYDWSYLESGPELWRVRVGRQEAAA